MKKILSALVLSLAVPAFAKEAPMVIQCLGPHVKLGTARIDVYQDGRVELHGGDHLGTLALIGKYSVVQGQSMLGGMTLTSLVVVDSVEKANFRLEILPRWEGAHSPYLSFFEKPFHAAQLQYFEKGQEKSSNEMYNDPAVVRSAHWIVCKSLPQKEG